MSPIVFAGSCTSGGLSTYADPAPSSPELVILGIYEPSVSSVDVTLSRTGVPITLVVSSYEAATWNISMGPGVTLSEVIVNGYEKSTVTGAGAATVTDRSGSGSYFSACAYVWPSSSGGCDTPGLVSGVEAATGLTLDGFAGCYKASAFSVQ